MSKLPGWMKRRGIKEEDGVQAINAAAPAPPDGERSAIPSINGSKFRPKAGAGMVLIVGGIFILVGMVGWNMTRQGTEPPNSGLPGQTRLTPAQGAEGTPMQAKLLPPEIKAPPAPVPAAPPPVVPRGLFSSGSWTSREP